MKLTFLGATHEVTGSCTMLECCGTVGLVDCGMEQGKDCFENQSLPVSPAGLDFVLLTHAHIDHSGLLPLLAPEPLFLLLPYIKSRGQTCVLSDTFRP